MRLFVAVLVLGFLLFGFVPSGAVAQGKAPKFWISNLEGERFDSRKHKGPMIISFFFVNCAPCIEEIPALYKMAGKLSPETALLFIDPVEEDTSEMIKAFAKRLNVPLSFFYHDSLGRIGKKYYKGKANMAFPTIFGVKDGKVVFRINQLNEEAKKKIRDLFG